MSFLRNCKCDGRHDWVDGIFPFPSGDRYEQNFGHQCSKCGLKVEGYEYNYND
ncbi:MAG: hypothetical protein J6Z43_10485 [Clostridiales bacterium]|nr:hypothetical protein [Clostridiales bacterium]